MIKVYRRVNFFKEIEKEFVKDDYVFVEDLDLHFFSGYSTPIQDLSALHREKNDLGLKSNP